MEGICSSCGKEFNYPELTEVCGVNVESSDLRPTVCSDKCGDNLLEEAQRERRIRAFRAILKTYPTAYKQLKQDDFAGLTIKPSINLKDVQVNDVVKRWVNSSQWVLCLAGRDTGIGKTRIALFALACLALKGKYNTESPQTSQEAGYWTSQEISDKFNAEKLDKSQRFIKSLYRMKVLLIDDLGEEHEFSRPLMSSIIKRREENQLKTILTTNLTPNSFKDRYKERVYSRILKGVFNFKGDDWRSK